MHECIVKGRWIGLATVVAVTIACMAASATATHHSDAIPPFGFGVAGFWLGLPYGLGAGSAVGWLAGRIQRARPIVLGAAAVAFVLAVDLTFAELADGEPIRPSMSTLYLLSVVPTLIGAMLLERWTRRLERVPTAIARDA